MPASSPPSRKKRARTKPETDENTDSSNNLAAPVFQDQNLQIVYDFLAQQNRPFSLQNIVDSLANKADLKKAALEKAISELVASDFVSCKEYGKTKLFLIRQKGFVLPTPEEAAALDQRLESLTAELGQISAVCRELETQLDRLNAQPRTEEAKDRVAVLQRDIEEATERIESLKEQGADFDDKTRITIQHRYEHALKGWRLRRSLAKQIIVQMAEGLERKPQALAEEIGIEVDADDWLGPSRRPASR
jgi:chromosome segregation ATPase